jgi:16S rRNA (cytidine1402-2'-O)-methyltransferase
VEALEDIVEIMGASRHLVIAREVTKLHEEFLRGRADELLDVGRSREPRGEITLLIGKREEMQVERDKPATPASVARRVQELLAAESMDEKTALKRVARELGISKSEAYRELQRTKG